MDILYNVKFIKYPSGWQVRVYDTIVGWKESDYEPTYDWCSDDRNREWIWDVEAQEYIEVIIPPSRTWLNPFTNTLEKPPESYEDYMKDSEWKKKHSIASSMGRTIQSVYHIARSNLWDWFVTLTFNPDKVDSFDYDITVKKLSYWLNNMRKQCPDMGYLIVPEKHPTSGRYHFHGLFKSCDALGFVPGPKKDKKGNLIYNVGKYKLGWSTATKIVDQSRVTKYIAKYISKEICQVAFGKRRYWSSKNLDDADVQEVVLDKEKQDRLLCRLGESATNIKRIESGGIVTTLYELPKEAALDESL